MQQATRNMKHFGKKNVSLFGVHSVKQIIQENFENYS